MCDEEEEGEANEKSDQEGISAVQRVQKGGRNTVMDQVKLW